MKTYHFKQIILFSILLGSSQVSWAGCDQTLSPGANVASAISSAAAGSTICLNSGSYGSTNLSNIVKTSDVTVQSASGNTASLSLNINGSNHLNFQNLTISQLDIAGGATKNITIRGSTFKGQAVLRMDGNSNANILIDSSTFDGISVCSNCYEGRLEVIGGSSQPVGVKITNSHFGGAGESDGIQVSAYGVVIGPGNVFDGIIQGSYGRHVDAIQGYGQSHTTITGNYFVNNSIQIMMPDGGNTETITNNVFIASSGNNGIQLGTHTNDTFFHNTVKNITVNMDKKVENSTSSSGNVARNNIMINSNFKTVDSGGNAACNNCTFDNNLFNSSGSAKGTNNLIGTPTFTGGTSPTTWPGYQLTSSSLGYKAATDGNDMGTNSYGAGTPPPPTAVVLTAPSNLRMN
jgi:hypothetical protein